MFFAHHRVIRNVEFLVNSMSTQRGHICKELGCVYFEEQAWSLLEVYSSIWIAEVVQLFEHEKHSRDLTFYSVRRLRVHITFSGCRHFYMHRRIGLGKDASCRQLSERCHSRPRSVRGLAERPLYPRLRCSSISFSPWVKLKRTPLELPDDGAQDC